MAAKKSLMSWWRGYSRYQKCLLGLFVVLWAVLAISPTTRGNWLLENALVAVFAPVLLVTGRYFRLSDFSYTLITVYLVLHIIGAHYDYANVPFGFTLGEWLGDGRNHYDRLVHFCFGLLLSYPVREMFLRVASVRGFWGYFLPLDVTLCLSAVYEIIEWLIAGAVAPDMGPDFLGTQGDPWDSQKDMALAGAGALLTMLVIAVVNWYYDPAFWRELREGFRVKEEQPLGEVRLRELIRARHEQKAKRPGKRKKRPKDGFS